MATQVAEDDALERLAPADGMPPVTRGQRMQDRYEDQAIQVASVSAAESNRIVADTNAETTGILQASAGKDPEFYKYFRALRSYDQLYGDPKRKNAATIVIPPGSAYLKAFNGE